jgi:hypothetical protein
MFTHQKFHGLVAAVAGTGIGGGQSSCPSGILLERTALQMTFSDMNRMRQSAPVRVWGGAISDGGRYWDR